jgi:hypothetical protein
VTETYADPIVGWRLWQVRRHADGYRLESLTWHHVAWPGGRRLEARCAVHREHAPAVGHECGIHAFTSRELAEDLFRRYTGVRQRYGRDYHELPPSAPGRPIALGSVSLWGRVLARDKGFRAQYAYPYELFLISADDEIARHLRDRYAVDVWVV